MQYTIASTVSLQMAPLGVAKGGAAIRQRVSENEARLTTDLDYARASGTDIDTFVDVYNERLATGWGGFTGVLKTGRSAKPSGVPTEYLMNRFDVKLKYLDQSFCTVIFELGHSEIGSADAPVERLGTDIAAIFAEIGLPEPAPVRVMTAEHQIAQKLHACTGPAAAERAHDLVDLQVLAAIEDLNYAEIGRIAPRLFAYRQDHEWPPTVIAYGGWSDLYASALTDLVNDAVLGALDDAVEFANNIIARAVTAVA